MENFSAIKRKGGLLRATTWVNLENTAQGKMPVTKTTDCVIPLIQMAQELHPQRQRGGDGPQGLALGGRSNHVTILRCPFRGMGKFWN